MEMNYMQQIMFYQTKFLFRMSKYIKTITLVLITFILLGNMLFGLVLSGSAPAEGYCVNLSWNTWANGVWYYELYRND